MWINVKAIFVIAAILVTTGLLRDAAARPGSAQLNPDNEVAPALRTPTIQSAQAQTLSEVSLRSISIGF